MTHHQHPPPNRNALARGASLLARTISAGLLLSALLMACSVNLENRRAYETVAAARQTPGSALWGWRVYQAHCASCHGAAASGGPYAPNLLPRMAALGPKRFETLVLMRYDLALPVEPASKPPGSASATPTPSMPAWQGAPSVETQIRDLYRYLSERSRGQLRPDQIPAE